MRIQSLMFAVLVSTIGSGQAFAQEGLPATPVANYGLVFDHPEHVVWERRPLDSVLSLVGAFLTERSEVPAPVQPPHIAFVPSAHIAAIRYRDVRSEPELLSFGGVKANALDMVYDDGPGVLYLSEYWTGGSPAELSVLLHGVVNHAQREAGLTYACVQEREGVAFAIQEAWLNLFGQTVRDTFGLDEAAYMISTQCLP